LGDDVCERLSRVDFVSRASGIRQEFRYPLLPPVTRILLMIRRLGNVSERPCRGKRLTWTSDRSAARLVPMRRRRRSPFHRIVYVLILAIVGLVIHGRITGQVITEGAVVVALFAGALAYEWYGRAGRRALPTGNARRPRETPTHGAPEALGDGRPDEDVAAGRGS